MPSDNGKTRKAQRKAEAALRLATANEAEPNYLADAEVTK